MAAPAPSRQKAEGDIGSCASLAARTAAPGVRARCRGEHAWAAGPAWGERGAGMGVRCVRGRGRECCRQSAARDGGAGPAPARPWQSPFPPPPLPASGSPYGAAEAGSRAGCPVTARPPCPLVAPVQQQQQSGKLRGSRPPTPAGPAGLPAAPPPAALRRPSHSPGGTRPPPRAGPNRGSAAAVAGAGADAAAAPGAHPARSAEPSPAERRPGPAPPPGPRGWA